MEKFGYRETQGMQAQRHTPTRLKNTMDFPERFLNVHIGKSDARNYAIETFIHKRQAFTTTLQISSIWKSYFSNSQTAAVDVKSRNPIRSSDSPRD